MQVREKTCQKTDSYASVDDNVSIDKIVDTQSAEKDKETKAVSLQMSQETEETAPAKEDTEFEEEKHVPSETSMKETSVSPANVDTADKSPSPSQPSIKMSNSAWRMDLHALGVSYKIKRLKQQLLMLERLTRKQEQTEINGVKQKEVKGFDLLMSSLNKQISRYQSLQSKIDEL